MRGVLQTAPSALHLHQNLASPNGAFENGTTNWSFYWGTGGGGTQAVQNDGTAPQALNYAHCVCTTAPTTGGCIFSWKNASSSYVYPGKTYVFAMWVRDSVTRTSGQVSVTWYDASSTTLTTSYSSGLTLNANEWAFLTYVAAAPASSVRASVAFGTNSTPAVIVGETFDITACQLELANNSTSGAVPGPYIQGSEMVDVASRNMIRDSSFSQVYGPNMATRNWSNISNYWTPTWRRVWDTTMGQWALEYDCSYSASVNAQGCIIFPCYSNDANYSLRPTTNVGEKWTVSAYMNIPSGQNMNIGLRSFKSNGTYVNEIGNTIAGTGVWQRYSCAFVLTSGYAGYYAGFQVRIESGAANYVDHAIIRITNVQVEKGPSATAFVATRPDW